VTEYPRLGVKYPPDGMCQTVRTSGYAFYRWGSFSNPYSSE